jgi:hypothetical protein
LPIGIKSARYFLYYTQFLVKLNPPAFLEVFAFAGFHITEKITILIYLYLMQCVIFLK